MWPIYGQSVSVASHVVPASLSRYSLSCCMSYAPKSGRPSTRIWSVLGAPAATTGTGSVEAMRRRVKIPECAGTVPAL